MPGRGHRRAQLPLLVAAGQLRVGVRLRADVRPGRGRPADVFPASKTERVVAGGRGEESGAPGLARGSTPTRAPQAAPDLPTSGEVNASQARPPTSGEVNASPARPPTSGEVNTSGSTPTPTPLPPAALAARGGC